MQKLYEKIKKLAHKLISTGFGHLFGSSAINKVLSFVSSLVLVRVIPKEAYGVYSNADNLLSLFCIFQGFGMTSTFLQYGCTSKGEKKDSIWSFCFYISLVFQIVVSCLIFIVSLTVKFAIPGTEYLLMLMAFLPIPRSIRDLQQIYLRTELRNQEFAYSNTLSTIVTVILSCSLSFLMHERGLIFSGYVSAIVVSVYIVLRCKVPFPKPQNNLEIHEKLGLLKFSAVCILNNSTSSIMHLIDTFILGITIASSTVTASYKIAAKIPVTLSFITVCVVNYIYPYFAKHKDDGKWLLKNYKRVVLLFASFNAVIVSILIIFAPLIIRIVFGEQYLDALVPFRLLCINYLVQAAFGTIAGHLMVSQEKLWFNTMTGFLGSGLNTILNIILIPRLAATGAALTTLAVSVLLSTMKVWYLLSLFRKKVQEN